MSAPYITTEEELLAWYEAHPYGEQDENGFDLGRLRENRRLTPAERVAKFEAFRKSVLKLRQAASDARTL